MAKYWATAPMLIEGPPARYGCHVFAEKRVMALCLAYGRNAEEAHAQAQHVIACLYAVERLPGAGDTARHYIARAPKLVTEDQTELEREYDAYFDQCEKANRMARPFEEWLGARHED